MELNFDGLNVVIPSGTEVILKDALVLVEAGVVVGRLDAKYDFKDLPERHHMTAVNCLMQRRMRLAMPSPEQLEQMDEERKEYRKFRDDFYALPWYKKLFARKPWDYHV